VPSNRSGPDWVHEVKHDGYRLIVRRDGAMVRLFTRRGYDWTLTFARRLAHVETIDQQDSAERAELAAAKRQHRASGAPARVFRDFRYRTLDSWSRRRRVVGKAEHNQDGANPRFVVTSLARSRYAARALYEEAATHCHAVRDYVSRDLFEKLMHDEEEHIDFLETQLDLVAKLGLELYAQHHIGELDGDQH